MIIIDDDGVMHKVLPIDTLDKIRAEIEIITNGISFIDKNKVFEIIDKYRNGVSS